MSHWMFSCNEVSQKVSESMDRTLPMRHRMMLRFHFFMCKYRARFRDQLLLISKALRGGVDSDEAHETPDVSFAEPRKRIKQTLRDQLEKTSG